MRGVILAFCCLAACSPAEAPPAAPQGTPAATRLMTWDDLTSRPKVSPTETIRWGPGPTDIVDLWLPEGAGPHPVVLMVHGGCWQKSIADRTLMNWAAEDLRKGGLAVWNIEYRGVDEEGGGYPGTYLDVAHAADALRDNAAKYNLRTDRIAAFGHSAGGHLALWLAARPKLPASSPLRMDNPLPIQGVINSGGLADLKASAPVTQPECLANIFDKLTGPPSATRPDVFSDTSPAEMLPLGVDVDQFVVNGDQDKVAPPILGQAYVKRVATSGDGGGLMIVAGTGHVELIVPDTRAFGIEATYLQDILR
jgi:acetyl esterase/lipase